MAPRRRRQRTLGPAVARFFGNFRHTKGPMAGERFVLDPFQRHDVDLMWQLDTKGRRMWRSILYGVARGNGKSPIGAGNGLVETVSRDDEPDVYCAAGKKDQARIIHDFASSFVMSGPLRDYCRVLKNSITFPANKGSLLTVAADGYTAHGLSISSGARDETHAWTSDKQVELYWAFDTATQKRVDPVLYDYTTAGWDKATLLGELYDDNMQTMDLDVLDDGFLVVGRNTAAKKLMIWRGAPAEADPSDPRTWRKANPASWIPDGELERLAHSLPENVFRRLILNQWTESEARWLPLGAWEKLQIEGGEAQDGEQLVIVFCGTYQRDCAALVACPPGTAHPLVLGKWERPLGDAGSGYTVPGRDVSEAIAAAMRRHPRSRLLVDRNGWEDMSEQWRERYGAAVQFPLESGRRKRISAAATEFYALVVDGGITHNGDPDLARHLAAVIAKDGPENGVILARPRNPDGSPKEGKYIELAIAAVLAVSEAADAPTRPWVVSR